MIHLKVPPNEALVLIRQIPHRRCQHAVDHHWREGGVAGVTAQSLCWLYCWAKTGMGSIHAASEAQRVFDAVFDQSYHWFDAKVAHEWARWARYASGDIESDLQQRLRPR
jgi:hypothetical protein